MDKLSKEERIVKEFIDGKTVYEMVLNMEINFTILIMNVIIIWMNGILKTGE